MKKTILIYTFLLTILSSCKKDNNNKNPEECYSNNNAQSIVHDGINREYDY